MKCVCGWVRVALFLLLAASVAVLQDAQALQAATKEMTKAVAQVRGLKFKNDVKVGVYNKDQLQKFLVAEMDKETTPAEIAANEKILKKFGLIPASLNLKEAVRDLLTSSIGGFYHPRTKEMRLIAGENNPQKDAMNAQLKKAFGCTMDDITLAHELCHAAQDQNFELLSYPLDDKHNDDLVQALKAIIEGDASLLGWRWGLKDKLDQVMPNVIQSYKSAKTGGQADSAPAFLRKSLTFPYGYGTDFVEGVWKANRQDWAAVTKLFSDPPESTEQILHPEKYANRDYPQVIAHADIERAFAGWKLLDHNVMGEFQILVLFEELGAPNPQAAAGWDGDRFWGFENGGKVMLVWFSTWDSENDATEFADAYAGVLSNKYSGSTREGDVISVSDTEKCLVRRKGPDVLVIDGGTPDVLSKVDSLFPGFKKTELKKIEKTKPKK